MGSAGRFAVVGVPVPHQGDLPVEILESKLYKPTIRPGVIPRPSLLARLRAARSVPTVAVVAPAGYGKTTLLALWEQDDDRPFAWVSLDAHDNEPIVLLSHLAVALDRISPLPPETFDALRSPGVSVPATLAPRLGAALSQLPEPVVLVLDDVHHLRDGASLDALVTLVDHVRGTTQIAIAGRGMPIPLARQRAQGGAVEIGAEGLAFTENGARLLLRAAGADLPDDEVVQLARRTEGWAAALYLAALARTGLRLSAEAAAPLNDDRFVAEYVQSELLTRLTARDLSFLTRTSVLDRLSGPLCDAMLLESGSAAELEHLQRNNLFLVPLDGQGEWYRYHSLFRDLLRQRLDRAGPEHSRELLRRAADWCEGAGELETALYYAQAAEDVDRVARIAISLAQPMYARGRSATAMEWFDWVDERGAAESHPATAAVAAYLCALTGRPAAADRWADLAERWAGRPSARDSAQGFAMWLTTLSALMCRHGVGRMRSDLDDAARHIPGSGSAVDTEYPMRLFLGGVANLLLGDAQTAEVRLTDAAELIDDTKRAPLFSTTLAYPGLIALAKGDQRGAEALAERALKVVRRGHAESFVTSVLVFSLAARVALNRQDFARARAHLRAAQRQRPLLSHALPWASVGALLEMAEVSIGLGDTSGARRYVRDADAVLRRRPDLGTLGKRTEELRGRLGAMEALGSEGATLTSAELRILPLLLTHLTVAGIADRLFLSRHTVKSQVWSMYRKLEVHTRSDAVARARELGLLEG
jgi:LuxR family maltose regulon positive regulatory protein